MTGIVFRNTWAFVTWSVTSFLCHYFATTFLNETQSKIEAALLVTACQLSFCYTSLYMKHDSKRSCRVLRLMACAGHALATFTTNYSMACFQASSTMAIKMTEPLVSAVVQRIVLSAQLQASTVLSLPVIVGGVLMFTGNPLANTATTTSIAMAIVSNICLAIRNIAMKTTFGEQQKLLIRSLKLSITIPLMTLVLSYALYHHGYRSLSLQIAAVTLSALFHVTYSFVSVALLLKSVSVLTHAILNIGKRVFVVLLLCVFGSRVVTINNLLGLLLAAAGLAIYTHRKTAPPSPDTQRMRHVKSRLGFILILCAVIVLACAMISLPSYNKDTRLTDNVLSRDYSDNVRNKREAARSDDPDDCNEINTEMKASESSSNYTAIRRPIPGFPFKTNEQLLKLSTMSEIIEEKQWIHLRLLNDLIGQYPYVILIDLPDHENKGDSAIAVGEITLLRELNKKVLFWCITKYCNRRNLAKARKEALKYGKDKVAVICHGGGNIFNYPRYDILRTRVFRLFSGYQTIVLSQSIGIPHNRSHLEYFRKKYSQYRNVTFLIRDTQSLARAKAYFPKNKLILAPDMAFNIGSVPRTIPPHYDVIWLKRKDRESMNYNTSEFTDRDITLEISDWLDWLPSKGMHNDLERLFVIAHNGLLFLQRGRVVITDRLHGHIMSTLLHIPHVLLDTNDNKLAAYHNTWTRGLEGTTVLTAKSPQDAVEKAQLLLNRFEGILPRVN